MSTPMVGTVRDMPVRDSDRVPMHVDAESGFPFDDQDFEREGSHSFRSQLDDLAKRHPEFAEHLNFGSGFPFRSHTLGRHRRGSDLNTENPSGSHEAEFRRHADRPFGSRFEQFGFPFSRHFDDEPDYYYADQTPPQAQGAQPEQKQKEPSSPQPTTDKPPQPPQSQERGRKQNIQQSNTVDLGQKQDPVDENRSQRSMSAPPENRSSGQRFISSINIPIQRPGGGDMGARTSQPQPEPQSQPQPQTQNRPNERVIPIHVEGRDEPVIPKNVNTPHSASPQPQTERIFGRAPGHFTQFLNKGEPHGLTPEEVFRQQQQQYQKPHTYHQQQQSQQQPTQQHQQPTQQQQQPTQQQQQPTQQQHQPTQQQPTQQQNQEQEPQFQEQAQQKSCKPSQFDQIQIIQKDVSELMNKVEKFAGKPRDKQYLYLDEMLTRNLIKLDNIETEGKDNIRQARKEAIKCIEGCIGILEAKANANAAAAAAAGQGEEVMDSERSAESQPTSETEPSKDEAATPSTELIASEKQHAMETDPAGLEVSGIVRSGSVVNTNAETTPMEVAHADSGTNGTDIQPATDKAEAQPSTGNVQSEPQESKETQSDSTNKGEGESPSTVINPEQTPEVKLEQQGEVKVENMEVTQGAEASQDVEKQSEGGENAEEKKEEKKEKKKGKKKEKTEKK